MHVVEEINRINSITNIRRGVTIRDRNNPFSNLDEEEFRRRYRFSKETVLNLISKLHSDIQSNTEQSTDIPPYLQILSSLRFFATGQFQLSTGDLIGISQSSISRIIKRVSISLAKK